MATIKYNHVYLSHSYTIAGPNEAAGNLKGFDEIIPNYYFGTNTFEQAEIKMQRTILDHLLSIDNHINLVVSGDLSNQIAISNYAISHYPLSFLGCYSACASFNESLLLLANLINSKAIKSGIALTSSHNLVAERQFRYPVEYGAPKPIRSTFTATGAVGVILTSNPTNISLTSATIGQVIDMGITDPFNMGAVMAPSAAETLFQHLTDLNIKPDDYDIILSGDLGRVGSSIFLDYLKIKYNIKLKNYFDAGALLYKNNQFDISGSSGPVTLPLVLINKILTTKKYHKILLLATGSLHSPTMLNQHQSIPAICHAISLEVL